LVWGRPALGLFLAGLASHAARRVGKEAEPLRGDLLATVLADAVRPLRATASGTLRLSAVLIEQAADALTGGAVALDLCHVGFSETLAH
jgi:hypothetical protein